MRHWAAMAVLGIKLMLAATATQPLGGSLPVEPVKSEVAAQRVAACGFSKVGPKFDELLQETVLEVTEVKSATSEQLRCAALASLASHHYVVFPDPVNHAFQLLYGEVARDHSKAEAEAWLQSRGLLARLPTYEPGRSDDLAFARSLEAICGPKARGVFEKVRGTVTMKPEALIAPRIDEETFWCLLLSAEASGYPLGFLGNEARQQN